MNLGYLYRLIILLCIMVLPHILYGQGVYVVTGKIQNNADEPLIGANIQLINPKHQDSPKGGITDIDGSFSISIEKGVYKMEISYVGYTKYTTNVEVKGNVSLPVITLNEDIKLMNEVVVVAQTITYNTDGYVAEISKNPFYKNMDLATVMKMTPGTYTTHNNVQVFGQNVSKIYMNGRELKLNGEQLVNYLATLNANNVKDMEVITASGVEEDAVNKGKSIIKITTINLETGGMASVGINTMNGEDKNIHSMHANVNWRINKKWGMYFNANGALGNSLFGNRIETHFYDTETWRFSETRTKNRLNGNIRSVLGISYDLTPNNLFSIEGAFSRNKNSNPSTTSIRSLSEGYFTDIANGDIDAVRKYERYKISFIYTHKFNKDAQLNFKVDRMSTTTDDNSLQHYEYIAGDNTGYNHWNKEKNLIHTASLDFTQKFKLLNGKLSAGTKGTWLTNESNTDYVTYLNNQQDKHTGYTDFYQYKENVYAFYAKYALTYKKLSMDFGLRMEHTHVSPESTSNPERNNECNYTDLFPEIGLNYAINKKKGHNINLSYDRGLTRPAMSHLNPLVRRISEYCYSMGNPLLQANYYDHYTMTAVWFNKYTLNVFYRYSEDGAFALSENRKGVLYTSYQNGMKRSYFSAHLGVPIKISKAIDVRVNANYGYRKESYLDNERGYHYYIIGYIANFKLPGNFLINQDLYYSSTSKSLYGKESERPVCNIVVTKTYPKKGLNVGVSLMDLFNSVGSKRTDLFHDDFYQISRAKHNNFGISFRLGYNLRWGKKSMVRRASAGNSSEANRVASE